MGVVMVRALALHSEPLISPIGDGHNWTSHQPQFPTFAVLHEALFNKRFDEADNQSHVVLSFSNPYRLRQNFADFPYSNLLPDIFQHFAFGCKPTTLCGVHFVVEVGSLYGHSAITMATVLDRADLHKVPILCIDPFTGDVNMWAAHTDAHVGGWVKIQDGRMMAFDQFMVNVKTASRHMSIQHILPFHTTSVVGARWLAYKGYNPDMVFIDSAHEEHETYVEIALYFRVLAPGGLLFGDDYDWPLVKHDVDLFVEKLTAINGPRACDFEVLTARVPRTGSSSSFWAVRKLK